MSINETREENHVDESSHEDRYVYYHNVSSLQEIISCKIARAIWQSNLEKYQAIKQEEKEEEINLIHCYHLLKFCYDDECQQYAQQLMNDLKVPRCIEDMLKNSLRKICSEISRWVAHLLDLVCRHSYLNGRYEIRHIDLKWCVWSTNGEIDFQKTARKIVEVGNLTNLQKFLVICEYCMEDEIKKFSLDSLPSEFVEKANYHFDRASFYWICYLRNEMGKVLAEDYYLTPELAMAKNFNSEYQFSNQFFWGCFGDNDQVRIAIDWICENLRSQNASHCIILEQVISAMCWPQQQRLLSEISKVIILYFALYSKSLRCVLWAWRNSKNNMCEGKFLELFCDLVRKGETATSISSLVEIWDTASDSQRNYAISKITSDKVADVFRCWPISDYYRFIAHISLKERKKIMCEETKANKKTIYWCDPDLLYCLTNGLSCSENQLMLLKLIIDCLRFVIHLRGIFRERNFQVFDKELKSYFNYDLNATQNLKKLFLQCPMSRFYDDLGIVANINKWNEYCQFVHETFGNDVNGARRTKRCFIHSLIYDKKIRIIDPEYYFDIRNGFDNLKKIVETEFADNLQILEDTKYWLSIYSLHNFMPRYKFDNEFKSKVKQWWLAGN